jgi:hypothetical protein
MFERFRRDKDGHEERGGVATMPRERERERMVDRDADREVVERDRTTTAATGTAAATPGLAREDMRHARARQRDEFGGFSWGAAFFGWLVAVGLAALLVGIASAAGAAIGLTEVSESEAASNAEEITLAGGIVLLAILLVAYYAGGYVAGRMSRFDGGRQGFGVWLLGLLVTVGVAAVAAIFGSEYNVFEQLDLPRIPVDEGDLETGGVIALVAAVLGTLVAAILGGKLGERYHRKVDRVAIVD